MEDAEIIDLFFLRSETAVTELEKSMEPLVNSWHSIF